jgi:hypothetical protein
MLDWHILPDGQKSTTGVQSKEGFLFVRVDHFLYHYVEGDRTMRVWVERSVDSRGYGETVYLQSFRRWLPPHDSNEVHESEQLTIRNRIEAAMGFMGVRVHFDEGEPGEFVAPDVNR